jgi:hypothetical protein
MSAFTNGGNRNPECALSARRPASADFFDAVTTIEKEMNVFNKGSVRVN